MVLLVNVGGYMKHKKNARLLKFRSLDDYEKISILFPMVLIRASCIEIKGKCIKCHCHAKQQIQKIIGT